MSYQNRNRQYSASHRRFSQRDPLLRSFRAGSGYQDGMSQYSYLRLNPLGGLDFLGLADLKECPCDCGDVCARAAQQGMDSVNGEPSGGGVICCNGSPTPCVWRHNLDPMENVDPVIQCIIQHEMDHFDAITCPDDRPRQECCPPTGTTCRVTRPNYNPGVDVRQEECHAFARELNCLNVRLSACGPYCPNIVFAISNVLDMMRELGC